MDAIKEAMIRAEDRGDCTEIIVNGSPFTVVKNDVAYDEIAIIAGHPGETDLTITYTRPPVDNHGVSGTLRPGHSIDIEPKMIFDAVRTARA